MQKNTEDTLSFIIENSYDGIFITDGDANTILVNKAYETITGLSREDVLGKNMRELEEQKTISVSGTLLALETGGPVTLHQEFRTGRRALITSSPAFDENGRIQMVVTNVRDMTDIYSLKAQIEASEDEQERIGRELEMMKQGYMSEDLIAEAPETLQVLRMAERVSALETLVILQGETGSGKEVFAKHIHKTSERKDKPFIKVNCGAIPENLIESELFGYEKGAFTGANREGKAGIFEVANGGTLFLDEIGELPLSMQVKLLRVLQEHEITRVGSSRTVSVDVRVIAATNKSLEEMVKEGTFREDLYYRLMVFPITIPPLRRRVRDIGPLTAYFTDNLNKKYGFRKFFSQESMTIMEEYAWPGNIRELKNVVERAIIISEQDEITPDDLPLFQKRNTRPVKDKRRLASEVSDLPAYLEQVEQRYIEEAYQKYHSVRKAAKSLNISPATFVRKRQKGLEKEKA